MNLIVISIVVSITALVIVQSVRNVKSDVLVSERNKFLPKVLSVGIVLFVTDIVLGGDLSVRFALDLSVVLLSVLLLNFSLPLEDSVSSFIRKTVFVLELVLSLYYALCHLEMLPLMHDMFFICAAVGVLLMTCLLFLWMISVRIYDIKILLKSGTVWAFVNLCVDAVYVLVPLVVTLVSVILYQVTGSSFLSVSIVIVFLAGEVTASSLRVVFDSAFVLCQKHERVIVESMKISHGEVSSANNSLDGMYNDIYERIVVYFEMQKPFLDSELTINDIVKVVYSNKVYISRAICHFTGRNFRQFVNYHRVMYSMDVFRRNPSLKVAELANLSGFNSVVSFTTAFRLFMNETPSEWCRKEKTRIVKTKN